MGEVSREHGRHNQLFRGRGVFGDKGCFIDTNVRHRCEVIVRVNDVLYFVPGGVGERTPDKSEGDLTG